MNLSGSRVRILTVLYGQTYTRFNLENHYLQLSEVKAYTTGGLSPYIDTTNITKDPYSWKAWAYTANVPSEYPGNFPQYLDGFFKHEASGNVNGPSTSFVDNDEYTFGRRNNYLNTYKSSVYPATDSNRRFLSYDNSVLCQTELL